jgi:hypothetical protein
MSPTTRNIGEFVKSFQFIAAVTIALMGSLSFAQTDEPKYLQVAREVVENVKPENNQYSNNPRYIRFPGDLFSSGYRVNTDCTGFIEASFERAGQPLPKFSTRMFRDKYSIVDWVDGVNRGESFTKLERIQDLKAGDLILWKYLPKYQQEKPTLVWNGHIVMVNAAPVKLEPKHPKVPGLTQWSVQVLDSTPGAVSPDDTRYARGTSVAQADAAQSEVPKLKAATGAGRGKYHVYTDSEGVIKGVSYGFAKSVVRMQDQDWHIVMARPK